MQQAEELVKIFHKIVHRVGNHDPQSKEVGQALSLVSQHGMEKAKYVIEYAAAKAVEPILRFSTSARFCPTPHGP